MVGVISTDHARLNGNAIILNDFTDFLLELCEEIFSLTHKVLVVIIITITNMIIVVVIALLIIIIIVIIKIMNITNGFPHAWLVSFDVPLLLEQRSYWANGKFDGDLRHNDEHVTSLYWLHFSVNALGVDCKMYLKSIYSKWAVSFSGST